MAMSVVYTTVAGRIVHENRGGVERFYGQDPLGSTAALYDSTGTKTDEYAYWPYGEIRSHSGSSTTPFTFVGTLGYYMDQAAQLYVRARFLVTSLARWLTVDPLWPEMRQYLYARNGPVGVTDSSGLDDSCIEPQHTTCSNFADKAMDVCVGAALTLAGLAAAALCTAPCAAGPNPICLACVAVFGTFLVLALLTCLVLYGYNILNCDKQWCGVGTCRATGPDMHTSMALPMVNAGTRQQASTRVL